MSVALDLDRLDGIRLSGSPRFQRVVARTLLEPSYEWGGRVSVTLEGAERVPDEPVIFAMNHTDRFNYWPFQLYWWKRHDRYTATWVKGKYYESRVVGTFMEWTNNIPTVSRGYLITKDFLQTLGRRPSDREYAALRAWVNAVAEGQPHVPSHVPAAIASRPRDILGRRFWPQRESYATAIDDLFRRMMRRFVALNEEAAALGLDLLVFPQGTRSVRLSEGHVGLSQIAMHLDRPVVPVGCNGTDRLYPGSSPIARPGHAVYRFGAPIRRGDAAAWTPRGTFEPFTPEAERAHGATFQAFVDDVMERIDGLLDEPYRFDRDKRSGGVEGSKRFV